MERPIFQWIRRIQTHVQVKQHYLLPSEVAVHLFCHNRPILKCQNVIVIAFEIKSKLKLRDCVTRIVKEERTIA